ncbi:MAG TPA: HAD-IIIA family hydrolase [Actinomycetes bacterium]|nr:HAD-IIIA family hydrolase [Actinomycetes bacterium]
MRGRPRLALLDRDGTINVRSTIRRYVVEPSEVTLLPGVEDAVRLLNDAGVDVAVVTNQRGLATGELTRTALEAVHAEIEARLAVAGARVDGWYVCPHDVERCSCRKPLPGLLVAALDDRPSVRPADAVVVGDNESDVLAGLAAGVPGVLLSAAAPESTAAMTVQPDLAAAVDWLLRPDEDTVTAR